MRTVILYVCSKATAPPEAILEIVPTNCEITATLTKLQTHPEAGFRIKLFDISDSQLQFLWAKLRKLLGLDCAYVEAPPEYLGCIKNWPGLFRPSLCVGSNL